MTAVDLDKIKPGDRVRVRHRGLEGWQTVAFDSRGRFLVELNRTFDYPSSQIEVLEHEPAPVKIEVELPEPGLFTNDIGKVDRSQTNGVFVKVGERGGLHCRADEAEPFALAILALVHEARS